MSRKARAPRNLTCATRPEAQSNFAGRVPATEEPLEQRESGEPCVVVPAHERARAG
jgi:hypothetical protein